MDNSAHANGSSRPARLPEPGRVDRRTVIRATVVGAVVVFVGLAFIGSYVGALHQARLHGVQIAVVGSPRLARDLAQGGSFAVTVVPSRAAAIRRIDHRSAFAAVIEGRHRDHVLLAGEAGLAVAQILSESLPPQLRSIQGPRTRVGFVDLKPLPAADNRGTSAFYLVIGLIVASYIGAAFLGLVFGTKPVGRRVWWRLLGVTEVGLAVSLLGIALVHAIGPLNGHYLALVGASLLLCLTVGSVAVGQQSALGVLGTGLIIQLFVVLGNPSAGGAYSTQLLPGFWRTIGPDLPNGAGVELIRNIAYFNGHATGRPLIVLTIWLLIGIGLASLFSMVRPRGIPFKIDQDQQDAEAAALIAASAG